MDKQIQEYEVRKFNPSPIWKGIGFALLFVFLTFLAAGLGYGAIQAWQRYFVPLEKAENRYEGWQVYLGERYGLGLRYPEDWEAKEVTGEFVVFQPKVDQPRAGTAPRDYITLEVKATGERPSTECENNHLSCSFYTNNIYGEKTITPETESIFFSKDGNDFTLTFYKFGDSEFASSAEGGASKIFKDMSESLRFVTDDEDSKGSES